MNIADPFLALKGIIARLALFKLVADLNAALNVGTIGFKSELTANN